MCIRDRIVYGAPVETRRGMVDADGEFYHYALGKMGASCGHLDPKKKGRTMCELFGAYGWSFGVRDMKYLLDHLLTCLLYTSIKCLCDQIGWKICSDRVVLF